MSFQNSQVHLDFGVPGAEFDRIVKEIDKNLQETTFVAFDAFEKSRIFLINLRRNQFDLFFFCNMGNHKKSVFDHLQQ